MASHTLMLVGGRVNSVVNQSSFPTGGALLSWPLFFLAPLLYTQKSPMRENRKNFLKKFFMKLYNDSFAVEFMVFCTIFLHNNLHQNGANDVVENADKPPPRLGFLGFELLRVRTMFFRGFRYSYLIVDFRSSFAASGYSIWIRSLNGCAKSYTSSKDFCSTEDIERPYLLVITLPLRQKKKINKIQLTTQGHPSNYLKRSIQMRTTAHLHVADTCRQSFSLAFNTMKLRCCTCFTFKSTIYI